MFPIFDLSSYRFSNQFLEHENLVIVLDFLLLCFIIYFIPKFISLSRINSSQVNNIGQTVFNSCSNVQCFRCSGSHNFILNDSQYKHVQQLVSQLNCPRLCSILEQYSKLKQSSEEAHDLKVEKMTFVLEHLKSEYHSFEQINQFYLCDFELLEKQVGEILSEFHNIYSNYPTLWKSNNTPSGKWEVCFLFNQGTVNYEVTELCPITYLVIKLLPNFMHACLYGNVAFSVIHPNTIISAHEGPTNIRYRCHLGLQIPNNCSLYVDDVEYTWGQDKCIIFDDSKSHSVTNQNKDSNGGIRVVLLVDFWHWSLNEREKKLITTLFTPAC